MDITRGIEMDIELDRLVPFEKYPFKIIEDTNLKLLMESISAIGIITPVIVRKKDDYYYEMLSGHRRLFVAKKLHLPKIPAIVVKADDNQAAIIVVESNFGNRHIVPSEFAHAHMLRREAVKSRNRQTDLNREKGTGKPGRKSYGMNSRQIRRYIRLCYLNSYYWDMVDRKYMTLEMAEQISYLNKDIQYLILDLIHQGDYPYLEDIKRLRKYLKFFRLDEEDVINVLTGKPDKYGLFQE